MPLRAFMTICHKLVNNTKMTIGPLLALSFWQLMLMDVLHSELLPAVDSLRATENLSSTSEGVVRLTTEEILLHFSDVRDDAQVQDSVGSTAVNYWFANGDFENAWKNKSGSGKVTGKWRASDDMRCVLILSGLGDRNGQESCSPIYRSGDQFMSLNSDGTVHGIHLLTPLKNAGESLIE